MWDTGTPPHVIREPSAAITSWKHLANERDLAALALAYVPQLRKKYRTKAGTCDAQQTYLQGCVAGMRAPLDATKAISRKRRPPRSCSLGLSSPSPRAPS